MSGKINIEVSDEDMQLIRRKVETGEFASVNQVIDAALHSLLRDDREEEQLLQALQAEVDAALDDPAPRTSLDRTFAELRGHMAKVADAHRAKLTG